MPHTSHAAALAACLLAIPAQSLAQDDEPSAVEGLVITPTRSGDPVRIDAIGSSITLITSDQVAERQTRVVSDVLRDAPGVSVSRLGGVGNLTQVRIRGAEANHTMTLIDGVEAGDPFQGEFDYAGLIVDDGARIEVLRGQQSALYGSDAIGGVIHYITPTGAEAPGLRLRLEGGSFETFGGALRVGGQSGAFDYVLSGAYQETDGFPTATRGERDMGSRLGSAGIKLAWTPSDAVRVQAVVRHLNTAADVNDEQFFPVFEVVDTPGGAYESETWLGMVRGEVGAEGGRWTGAVTLQGADGERDRFAFGSRVGGDLGRRAKASVEGVLRLDENQRLVAAVDLERETFQNTAAPGPFSPDPTRRHIDNQGLVLEYAFTGERLGFGAAVRRDDNDRFQEATTWRLQSSVKTGAGLRLRAAAGTGIKNPSQTELFGFNADLFPFVGNPDLKPERSTGWEVGLDKTLAAGRVTVGLTYFNATLEDEIFTDFAANPNTAGNRTTDSNQEGVEFHVQGRFGAWGIDGAYTYLDAEEDGVREIRRPPHSASLNVSWRDPADRYGANLTVRHNGEAFDTDFAAFTRVVLDDFTLVNVSAHRRMSERVELFGRIENLFDEEYQEVLAYRTSGIAAYAGVRTRY